MKNLYPFIYWGRQAAENPEETKTFFAIVLLLLQWALVVAISSAIFALLAAGIAKFFGKDFEEWLKGSFTVLVIIQVLGTVLQCVS